jgi:Fe-S-cluster-containing dehydrogenase component
MKTFLIDLNKCVGCFNCQLVCKDEHVGNDWTPYAKPQPETGHFWIKVNEKVRGTVPKVRISYLPMPCMHCDEAPCMPACPEGAIFKREDGLVLIDPEKCVGCMNCLDSCPYGVIYFNRDLNIAQKCTGCAHLIDQGWKEPRCVDACPTGALQFGEEEELHQAISQSEILHPEYETRPRVHYVALPKRFVAGAVFDPEEDECLAQAAVTLVNAQTGVRLTGATDAFGDFWFEGLDVGTYHLKVEASGYLAREFRDVSTEEDVNLGDIALYKAVVAA